MAPFLPGGGLVVSPITVPLLPDLVLLGTGGVILALVVRRSNLISVPALMTVGGMGVLMVGVLADVVVWATGGMPAGMVDFASQRPWTPWQVVGMALVGLGAGWHAVERSRKHRLFAKLGAGVPAACALCRDEDTLQVCVRPDGTISSATTGFARATGRRLEDLVGQPLDALLTFPGAGGKGTSAAEVLAPFFAGPDRPEGGVSAVLHSASGEGMPAMVGVRLHRCAGQGILRLSIQDGRAVQAAERHARDARNLLNALMESAPVGILTTDRAGQVLSANRSMAGLLGLPRQSMVGRLLTAVLEQVAADRFDAEEFLRRLWQEGGGSRWLRVRRVGQQAVPVELAGRVLWEAPEPILVLFAASRAYERRLERQLAGVHRLSVLGKLFMGTAHDVNNALASILAWGQWLRRLGGVRGEEGERVEEGLTAIERAAADASHLLRRAVDLARGRPRRSPMVPVDLNEVVADSLAICRSRLQQPDAPICLEQHLAREAVVSGDPAELRELLINLILNALEAMPHGGTLRISTQSDAEHVRLAVADTGRGMDAAVRHRIFEPFFTTRGHRGSGLGLTLVRQIALRHRAEIEVETEPGKGTTMRVVFPRSTLAAGSADTRDRARPMPTPPPPPDEVRRTGRILIVDDQPAMQRVLEDVLTHAGHQVRTAGQARQALTAAIRREFDCILIDIQMPGLDGWQLAARIRQDDPSVGLVMVSGAVPTALRKPFDLAIEKPFHLDRLLEVVEEAIRLAEARRSATAVG